MLIALDVDFDAGCRRGDAKAALNNDPLHPAASVRPVSVKLYRAVKIGSGKVCLASPELSIRARPGEGNVKRISRLVY